jgi:hypothetical protein
MSPPTHAPPLDRALSLLNQHFFNRTDVVCHKARWGDPCPALGGDNLDALLRSHLLGERCKLTWTSKDNPRGTEVMGTAWRIGTYTPALDGTTRWLVLDLDAGRDHANPIADATAQALSIVHRAAGAGLPAYLERSKNGAGWHVWAFFERPLSAAKVRRLGRALVPPLAFLGDGSVADDAAEIFPKSEKPHTVGNQVWLPWHCQARLGGNLFYRRSDEGLEPFAPESLDAATEGQVDHALLKLEGRRA